jgi:hypothetical protein
MFLLPIISKLTFRKSKRRNFKTPKRSKIFSPTSLKMQQTENPPTFHEKYP